MMIEENQPTETKSEAQQECVDPVESKSPRPQATMTAYTVLILILSMAMAMAMAMVTGLSVVPDPFASGGTMLSSKAVFSEPAPLNVTLSTLLVVEETFVDGLDLDFSPSLAVAIPVALQEEEEPVLFLDAPPPFPNKNKEATDADSSHADSTTRGPFDYCFKFASSLWQDALPCLKESYDLASSLWQDASPRLQEIYGLASSLWQDASPRLQESYDLASSLWQDASRRIAYSHEQINRKDGSAIRVSRISLHIFLTRFSITIESGIVNDSPDSSVSVVFISPEITRILSKQCPLTSSSQPTCNVDAMGVLVLSALPEDAKLLTQAFHVIFLLVLIALIAFLGRHQWPNAAICSFRCSSCRVYRFSSVAIKFVKRAVLYFPDERDDIEVRDLCVGMLKREYFLATATGEIIDVFKESMIKTVRNARSTFWPLERSRLAAIRQYSLQGLLFGRYRYRRKQR
jgi:hypothetical protein